MAHPKCSWAGQHVKDSCHICEGVTSYKACVTWKMHVKCSFECSWAKNERFMFHRWKRHVSHTAASCMFLMDDSSKVFVGKMWEINVTYVNDSCDSVMFLTQQHRLYSDGRLIQSVCGQNVNDSCHICDRVMLHMWKIHVTASSLRHRNNAHVSDGRLIQSVRGQNVKD